MQFLLQALLKRSNRERMQFLADNPVATQAKFPRFTAHHSIGAGSPWLDSFNALHGWQDPDLHPALLQVKSLPLQLQCILDQSSPFPALGLVHVGNQITCPTRLYAGSYTLNAQITAVNRHRKGLMLSITTTAEQGSQCVYEARSDYLYRLRAKQQTQTIIERDEPATTSRMQELQQYTFSASIGRQYAKISGDYNPIHLWPLSAKLFGFDHPIVHGMHSLSLSLSTLRARGLMTNSFTVSNQFIQPAMLPSAGALYLKGTGPNSITTREFQLFQLDDGKPDFHSKPILQGAVSAAASCG